MSSNGNPLAALRQRRLKLGLTMDEVAARIINPMTGKRVTLGSVHRWELGKQAPPVGLLKLWTAVLDKAERGHG